MLKEIVIAIEGYFAAYRFMLKNKLWKWIIIPGIIYAVLFVISMYLFGSSANNFIEWILRTTHLNNWLQRIDSGFLAFLLTFDAIILWMVLMLFYFSLFKYLWLILCSPVFAYLSEKTEAIMEERELHFKWKQLWRDVRRGCFYCSKKCIMANGLYHLYFNTCTNTGYWMDKSPYCYNGRMLLLRFFNARL